MGSQISRGTGGLTSRICVVAEAARDLGLRDGGMDNTLAKRCGVVALFLRTGGGCFLMVKM